MDGGREEARAKLLVSIRRRMYSIAEYMRMIKKWFSDAYNERNGHKGTMWEAVYGDNPFPMPEEDGDKEDLRDILAYIHLNPIRAAIADRFEGYPWSSYSAYRRGDEVAVAAMRRAYVGFSDDEIVEIHESRMARLLEEFAHTTLHGAIAGRTQTREVQFYNLDVVISVGCRVKSIEGTRFRQWATRVLREMLMNRLEEIKRLGKLERRVDSIEQDVKQIRGGVTYLIDHLVLGRSGFEPSFVSIRRLVRW